MSSFRLCIPAEDFYCGRNLLQDKIEAIIRKDSHAGENHVMPKFMNSLSGPSKTWKVFKRQGDAIDCCFKRRNGLMPFAYEDVNGRRMFLAAHPKVFWALNRHRFFKNCYSYEIIREYSACKLYLDLEFESAYNSDRNGARMLSNLLIIININLRNSFDIICGEDDVLDLDSGSDCKFSHHVIYEILNVAFRDNYAVGNFVRRICGELKEAYQTNVLGDSSKLKEVSAKYGLQQDDVLELFIQDQKGQIKLFIDESVYTKNRHFRLLGSSKLAKHVPLTICKSNKYKLSASPHGLDYFLDSLVTYFSWEVARVLECEEAAKWRPQKTERIQRSKPEHSESCIRSEIDEFIRKLISPKGWIRRRVYFSDSCTVVYDIQGYRYCHNIQQEHKSNNIKYIVDLNSLKFYQKCYDPDCADFRSETRPLPEGICFLFEDDSLFESESPSFEEFPEDEFVLAVEKSQRESRFEQSIPDEILHEIIDSTEATMDAHCYASSLVLCVRGTTEWTNIRESTDFNLDCYHNMQMIIYLYNNGLAKLLMRKPTGEEFLKMAEGRR